ncbi:E3 ubiquitin ligase complex SCF subunit sconC [Trichinella pseudospiralis]|uniref:E3 ubiquitin ligase complex SCF subunit sconC n=1 Tax=Trichinella pseudospiralis TaxID=6337 RepID=A0A0V1JVV8_TRIPS|nr:E3 ubiquitin ligase complex SCF subunit sconC [Trichinella pseudospiralis]
MSDKRKVVSSDGVVFEADLAILKKSQVIKELLEKETDGVDSAITIESITGDLLGKVLLYCANQPVNENKPRVNRPLERTPDVMSSFDLEFFNVDPETLFNLISVAIALKIDCLLENSSKYAAHMIRGKTGDDIRQLLEISLVEQTSKETDFLISDDEDEQQKEAEQDVEMHAGEGRRKVQCDVTAFQRFIRGQAEAMAAGHKRNSETSSKRNWTNSTTQKGVAYHCPIYKDSHKAPDCPEVLKADYSKRKITAGVDATNSLAAPAGGKSSDPPQDKEQKEGEQPRPIRMNYSSGDESGGTRLQRLPIAAHVVRSVCREAQKSWLVNLWLCPLIAEAEERAVCDFARIRKRYVVPQKQLYRLIAYHIKKELKKHLKSNSGFLKCIQYRQMDRQLQVISREGKSFSISLQAAKMSLTLRNMFDYIVNDELNDEIEAIPLGLIDSNTLDKIVQFCEHYKTETNPEEERSYEINEWDSNFFDINISTMFDIAKAADYLQIHRLFDISCKIVAKFLRSKSPQDIRQALGMGNDFEEYQNDKVFNAL